MTERFEQDPQERTPEPLDLVRIDGRWAQVKGGGGAITFLDSGEDREIDWDQYRLSKSFNRGALGTVIALQPDFLTEDEIDRIHWAGDDTNPDFKLMAPVWGEYKKLNPV